MKRLLNLVCFVSLCSLTVLLFSCDQQSFSQDEEGEEDTFVLPVEAAEVVAGDISAFFTGTATLEAEEETDVVARVGGVVEEIFVEEGGEVQAGQVLAKLDDDQLTLQLERSRANLEKLENSFRRSQGLFEKSLLSTEDFQSTKYEYEYQKAEFNLAELELGYTSIRAPISGVIAQRFVKIGNMILPNQAAFHIKGLDPIIAVLHVPEHQMSKLSTGQEARLRFDALENTELIGRIDRISPVVDPLTGTLKVTVAVEDTSRRLKPGMFVRVHIIHDTHRQAVLVPKDAVITEDKLKTVFVVDGDVARRRTIETGYINTSHIEVLEGLSPGDRVVTAGKGSLKDATPIEVISER